MYGAVLTGKGTYVVGKQQMAFDTKLFPLKDCGKTNTHLSTLYKILGRIPDLHSSLILLLLVPQLLKMKKMQLNQIRVNKQGG